MTSYYLRRGENWCSPTWLLEAMSCSQALATAGGRRSLRDRNGQPSLNSRLALLRLLLVLLFLLVWGMQGEERALRGIEIGGHRRRNRRRWTR